MNVYYINILISFEETQQNMTPVVAAARRFGILQVDEYYGYFYSLIRLVLSFIFD